MQSTEAEKHNLISLPSDVFMKLAITENGYPTFSVFNQQSEKGGRGELFSSCDWTVPQGLNWQGK